MIMKRRIPQAPSRGQLAALALVALTALLVFPTWAERDPERVVPQPETAAASEAAEHAETALRDSLMALEREATVLEQQLEAIRAQQAVLAQEFRLRTKHAALAQVDRERAIMAEQMHHVAAALEQAHSEGALEREMRHKALKDAERSATIRALEEQIRVLSEELARRGAI